MVAFAKLFKTKLSSSSFKINVLPCMTTITYLARRDIMFLASLEVPDDSTLSGAINVSEIKMKNEPKWPLFEVFRLYLT